METRELKPDEIIIKLWRFEELQMLENRNKIQEAKIESLLKEIRRLKNENVLEHSDDRATRKSEAKYL